MRKNNRHSLTKVLEDESMRLASVDTQNLAWSRISSELKLDEEAVEEGFVKDTDEQHGHKPSKFKNRFSPPMLIMGLVASLALVVGVYVGFWQNQAEETDIFDSLPPLSGTEHIDGAFSDIPSAGADRAEIEKWLLEYSEQAGIADRAALAEFASEHALELTAQEEDTDGGSYLFYRAEFGEDQLFVCERLDSFGGYGMKYLFAAAGSRSPGTGELSLWYELN